MRKPCAILALAAMLLGSTPVRSDDHLVSRGAVAASLAEAAAERTSNLASLDQVLTSDRASRAAAMAGFDLEQVRGSLSRLNDEELRNLSWRAAALNSDPAAGHGYHDGVELLVVVALLGAIILVVLEASRR